MFDTTPTCDPGAGRRSCRFPVLFGVWVGALKNYLAPRRCGLFWFAVGFVVAALEWTAKLLNATTTCRHSCPDDAREPGTLQLRPS